MYKDLHTAVKGKYLGAGGNPISTALERVQSLSSHVLTYPNATISLRLPLQCNAAVYPVWHNILRSIICTIFLIGLRKEY